ncbi:MAG: helix-turn-helix transcriptional regulator [Dethiobacteria bacterium]|jgi:ribosome-binding protein aMBF1 (putative translation factor)
MPFKKLNVQKIINEKIKTDDKFAAAYSEVENEYKLIREVVKARKEQGLTQQELADMVGVKQQVISRFEREKHIPTLDNFLKILDGVGLELKLEKKQDRH